ncbi:MAG TPA: hypothetical protein VEX37_07195 [Thermomicrobiales bacterium]|nr:hypothetical protein [Thermomicrobiales bacterium]
MVLLGMAALFIPTGLRMRDDYRERQLDACLTAPSAQCDLAIDQFEETFATVIGLTDWFAVLPILFGTLIAAPFVLELERRSYRLAWTQSITRQRWTVIKLGTIVVGALVSSALLALLLSWWRTPLASIHGRLEPGAFQIEGIALAIYGLFSAALVVAFGTVLRRTVPTIVIAAVVFIAIRVVIETWLRPYYQAAKTGDESTLSTILQTAWLLQQQTNIDGTVIIDYHPDDRFWRFQLIESAIFLAISTVLITFSAFWILRQVD